jgi:hypothetical protein
MCAQMMCMRAPLIGYARSRRYERAVPTRIRPSAGGLLGATGPDIFCEIFKEGIHI